MSATSTCGEGPSLAGPCWRSTHIYRLADVRGPMPEGGGCAGGEFVASLLCQALSAPSIAIGLIFVWASGTILSFLFIAPREKFDKHREIHESATFHVALGLAFAAVVVVIYSFVVLRRLPASLADLESVMLPSGVLSAGVTAVIFVGVLFWSR